MNCVPLATANTYGIKYPGENTGLSKREIKRWIKEMPLEGTTEEFAENKGLYYMHYYRNFSSRPPITEDGETSEKIWTDEPMIIFIEKLLKSGFLPKQRTRGYSEKNANYKFNDGCIHVTLYKQFNEPWHDVNFCINEGEVFIIDIQKQQKRNQIANKIRGQIGPDTQALNYYLSDFCQNYFSIVTENIEKQRSHNSILQSRLQNISFNRQLNAQQTQKVRSPLPDEVIQRLNSMMHMSYPITPSILSFPYNSFIFTNETKNILMPLIFNINQDSQWPDSVKDTARKYSQFQDNKYPQIIRETALSAILNGEDNVVLDHLYNLAPEPLISFGDFPITKTKDRIAEENRFTDEVSKAELELKRALYRDAAEEFQQEISKVIQRILKSRDNIVSNVFDYGCSKEVYVPVKFTRIIENIRHQLKMRKNTMVNVTPLECLKIVGKCKQD